MDCSVFQTEILTTEKTAEVVMDLDVSLRGAIIYKPYGTYLLERVSLFTGIINTINSFMPLQAR